MNKKLLNIGLTGARCSGKDSVAKLFRQIGIPVFEADIILKYILNYKDDVVDSVHKNLGKEYIFSDFINPISFDDDIKFNKLIDLVEFDLFEAYKRFRELHKDKQYTIFHSSIIYERVWYNKFDRIISVFAPIETRIERYKMHSTDRLETIWNSFSKEMNDNKKNQMSDFIIHNYGYFDVLNQVEKIDNQLVDYYFSLNKKLELDSFSHKRNI